MNPINTDKNTQNLQKNTSSQSQTTPVEIELSQEQLNSFLITQHEQSYSDTQKMIESSLETFINGNTLSTVPNMLPPIPRSRYEINTSSLKEISIQELQFKRNEDFFIQLKIIRKSWKIPGPSFATNLLLQDKRGDIARGALYNILAFDDWKKLEKMFSVGRELIILHPFFRMAQDGLPTIRVENRYEFFFSDEAPSSTLSFQDLLQKSKALKDEANQFLKKNINSSLDYYSKALDVLLRNKPRLVPEKEDFLLEWKVNLNEKREERSNGASCNSLF